MTFSALAKPFCRVAAVVCLIATGSATAFAHPGHGRTGNVEQGNTIIHYLTEPIHAAGILGSIAVLAVVAVIGVRIYRNAARE